jgi:transposase-like protein
VIAHCEGRPRISTATRAQIVEMLQTGTGIWATARVLGTGNETAARIKRETAALATL